MTRQSIAAIAAAVAVSTACVTINVYFPAAAIKDLSKQIEDEIRKEAAAQAAESVGGEVEPAPADPGTAPATPPPPPSGVSSLLGITPAFAQESVPNPEISNPAIRKIIDSRAARVTRLNEFKAKGVIGENSEALVEARSLESLTDLKDRAEVARLVKAENADREELFREIAAAKKVSSADIPKIRETYASTLRENARSGDWIQTSDGAWKQK